MRRCKMRLIQWFLWFWMNFVGLPDILGGNRVKLPEFGGHRTEFGGAYIVRTRDSRKIIFFTWIMNKSFCKIFLGEIRPWSTFTSHNQPSPEIWFEKEHFEILSFSGSGSKFHLSPLHLGMALEKNSHGFWKFGNFNWTPLEVMNKTKKSFRNRRSLVVQPILCQNTVFAKIEVKLAPQSAFKLW